MQCTLPYGQCREMANHVERDSKIKREGKNGRRGRGNVMQGACLFFSSPSFLLPFDERHDLQTGTNWVLYNNNRRSRDGGCHGGRSILIPFVSVVFFSVN